MATGAAAVAVAAAAGVAYAAAPRRLAMDDALLAPGNEEREARAARRVVTDGDAVLAAWRTAAPGGGDVPRCSACRARFASAAELASHEALQHMHVCRTCGASFVTERWVTLHVREAHDHLFAVMAGRRLPVYACIVDGCAATFRSARARQRHALRGHALPLAIVRGTAARRSGATSPAPPPRRRQRCKFFTTAAGCAAGAACTFRHAAADAGGDARGALPASQACYYFNTRRGCNKGAGCPFRHDAASAEELRAARARLFDVRAQGGGGRGGGDDAGGGGRGGSGDAGGGGGGGGNDAGGGSGGGGDDAVDDCSDLTAALAAMSVALPSAVSFGGRGRGRGRHHR